MIFLRGQHAFYFIIQLQCLTCYNRWHDTKQMASLAIFVRKSTSHLHDQGVKKRNSYSVLVTIDMTRTNIITYNIVSGIKKGQSQPDKLENFPKGGLQPPQPSPWISLCPVEGGRALETAFVAKHVRDGQSMVKANQNILL